MTSSAPIAVPVADDVDVELRAPARVRWSPSTLEPAHAPLGVVLTNRSAAPADVSDLRVRLDAERDGVSFCAREVGAEPREPRVLAPGASFTFDRVLDCSLPLAGTYAVRVRVAFGGRAWRDARTFSLRVVAPSEAQPRAIEAVPGVYAALGASNLLFGESGAGRVVVALVNGGKGAAELPPMHLAMRVYRVGTPIPCEDEPMPLVAPPVLAPGATWRLPVGVSCLGLSTPGVYDVEARIVVDGVSETPIGRVRVEITNDPARRTPYL